MDSETLTREQCLYLAKLAEQAERYDEMAGFMERLVRGFGDLTVEERNLCSAAYKNLVGSRRAAWRIASSVELKEEGRRDEDHAALARGFRARIEAELASVCGAILDLIDSYLAPSATSSEAKVFYLKMKGDYHRYLAEIKTGEERKEAAVETMEAYKAAQAIALADLALTHPLRLGLALNFSVFYYEILGFSETACSIAKQAFDEAISELDNIGEECYKDSTLIMQLLRDNLMIWTSKAQGQTDEVWRASCLIVHPGEMDSDVICLSEHKIEQAIKICRS